MDVADNISLERILYDWEELQTAQYGVRPVLSRQVAASEAAGPLRRPARRPSLQQRGGSQTGGNEAPISGQMAALQRREKAAAAATLSTATANAGVGGCATTSGSSCTERTPADLLVNGQGCGGSGSSSGAGASITSASDHLTWLPRPLPVRPFLAHALSRMQGQPVLHACCVVLQL